MRIVDEVFVSMYNSSDIYILDGVIFRIKITEDKMKLKHWLKNFKIGDKLTPKQIIMMKHLDGVIVEEDGECFLNNVNLA